MATLKLPLRRFLLTGGFAVAVAAAPAVVAFAVPTTAGPVPSIAACVTGESEDVYTGSCVPDLVPNSPEMPSASGTLPEVDGIPCTGANSGQCIGLSEEQQAEGPIAVPHSSVSSSP